MKHLILVVLGLSVLQIATQTPESLKLVHVVSYITGTPVMLINGGKIFRHGERTPTATYKNDPYRHWPEGWGQLTKRGKKQLYDLGVQLRNTYSRFLSEYYIPDEVYILSSYADRCLMSAEVLLAGLYPPVKEQIWNTNLLWQPIPMKYLPRSLDNLIAMKKKCPVYDNALRAAYESERIQQINTDSSDLYEYLTENTGEQIYNISKVESLYNTLEIERLHNLQLPEWTKKVQMQKMQILAAENLAIFTDTTLMKRLQGGPLLKEIISRMSDKSESNSVSKLNLVLYSAHDLTVVSIMRTLGFTELLKPDYGASLVFELHLINDSYEVQLFYRSNATQNNEHLEMQFCRKPCLLRNFIQSLQEVLPTDWERECMSTNTY